MVTGLLILCLSTQAQQITVPRELDFPPEINSFAWQYLSMQMNLFLEENQVL